MSEKKHTPIFLAIKTALAKRDEDAVCGVGEWRTGMFCGLEDRNITDRYDACEYGYKKALDRVDEWILDGLDDLIDQACKSHDQDQKTIKDLVDMLKAIRKHEEKRHQAGSGYDFTVHELTKAALAKVEKGE